MTEDRLTRALLAWREATVDALARWNRFDIGGATDAPAEQVLFVGNHGFGGLFDLNIAAAWAALSRMNLDHPLTILAHQLTWTVGLGPLAERLGVRKASAASARTAFEQGNHVLVFPGGDLDAFKSHKDKDRIIFGGRTGFARLAIECGVPIVPIVTAGAGDTLHVLSDGQQLAKSLRLDKLLRLKALPITISAPWGLSIGLVGLLPYLPLRAQIRTRVLPAMHSSPDEDAAAFAARVEAAMQSALDELAEPQA